MGYDRYTFKMGEGSSAGTRIYSGTMLSPMRGFKLGLQVAKMISNVLNKIDADKNFSEFFNSLQEGEKDDNAIMQSGIRFLVKCLGVINIDEYLELVYEVIRNTPVYAKVDNMETKNKDSLLNNEGELNNWFKKFPQDLLMFSAHVLIKNSSPFLPEEIKAGIPKMLNIQSLTK